jgi:murein DD-endopeptidase MepM/ murein hydrolase activator NlpD
MTSRVSYLVLLVAWIAALWWGLDSAARWKAAPVAVPTTQQDWPEFFAANILPGLPVAEEFDTPLRPPDGDGATVTLPFLFQGQGTGPKHLGEDWATAKGDAAKGEPVYSVADGWVSVAQDFQNAFGKVVFICYRLPDDRWPPFVEMMYAELDTIEVHAGDFVKRGQRIGTVGTAGGTYPAHLHWELRQTVGLGVGPGWDTKRDGWLGPSEFIVAHRGPRAKQPLLMKILTDADRDGWGTDY